MDENEFESLLYREAVTAQSPGLLQPWEAQIEDFNRNAVASFVGDVGSKFLTNRVSCNPFRVEFTATLPPRVEATLGFGA
jgi:hypothetical protein